jgi:ADP-ribose pyrophosphatase
MSADEEEGAVISARTVVFDSPWVQLVSKTVVMQAGAPSEDYYALRNPDYATVCPRRGDGKFVLVRQFRPAVERYVWEFPSGHVEPGETPTEAIVRELVEETGHASVRPILLGSYFPDVGRLDCRGHLLYSAAEPVAGWIKEPNVAVGLFDAAAIDRLVEVEEFCQLQHIALWLMVKARGLI